MSIDLVIVTPYGEAYRGPVESIVLPGTEGEFGVLAQHERFLSPLEIGGVEIRNADGSVFAAIATGFAEVDREHVTLLVESCEVDREIDVARAELARDRAREGMAAVAADAERERYAAFEAALVRAENRLSVAGRGSS